jgi:hypothetical protein
LPAGRDALAQSLMDTRSPPGGQEHLKLRPSRMHFSFLAEFYLFLPDW